MENIKENSGAGDEDFSEKPNSNSSFNSVSVADAGSAPEMVPRTPSRTPFTSLSQLDADFALARALHEQERAFMMLRMGGIDGSDYVSSYGGSYEEEEDELDGDHELVNGDESRVEGSDYGEDGFNANESGINSADFENDEAYARAVQDNEERDAAVRLRDVAGLNDWGVVEHEDHANHHQSLKKEKILRLFKLNTGQDDHAIMFFEDYINQMDIAVKKLGARSQHDIEVFEWFKIHVLEYKLDVSIDHQELLIMLSAGGEVKDEDITLLINAGLLTRQMIDPNMYWFAIPYIGSVLKGLSQGRKELLSFLNRRKYKEMLFAPLEKKRLRLSPLDMRFHLRDLIGSGHLKVLQTPSGMLVRVSKD